MKRNVNRGSEVNYWNELIYYVHLALVISGGILWVLIAAFGLGAFL